MPKDLTKLSLKEFDMVSERQFEQRLSWNNGHLEMTIMAAHYGPSGDDDDGDD